MRKINKLEIISLMIIAITSFLFLVIIPLINSEMYSQELLLNNLTFQKDILAHQLEINDLRTNRVVTLQDDYLLLTEINASSTAEVKGLFEIESRSLIPTLNYEYYLENKDNIDRLNLSEINKLHRQLVENNVLEYNKLNKEEKQIADKIDSFRRTRDFLNILFGISQIIGLFIGILAKIYEDSFLEPELRPEYIGKLEKIKKGKYSKVFSSVGELDSYIKSRNA